MSSPRKTQLPGLPTVGRTPEEIDRLLRGLKELTEVGHGRRGDPLDRFVTVRELRDAGVVRAAGKGGGVAIAGPGGDGSSPNDQGAPPFSPGDPDFGEDDYAAPLRPTGVTARSVAPNTVMVTWNPPAYNNHAYAEVYAMMEPLPRPGGVPQVRTLNDIRNSQPGFNESRPWNASTNPHVRFLGQADGTIFTHNSVIEQQTASNQLDSALSPVRWFYFVRFVSTARVPGLFHTEGVGAVAARAIDPGRVLDLMVANVSSSEIYANLRALIGLDTSQIRAGGGIQSFITNEISEVNGDISSIWSVRQQFNSYGVAYSAGFGLGVTASQSQGTIRSTFLVAADQFAVMTPTWAVKPISFARDSTNFRRATVQWPTNLTFTPAFAAGQQVKFIGDSSVQPAGALAGTIPFPPPNGPREYVAEVIGVGTGQATLELPTGIAWPIANATLQQLEAANLALLLEAAIPFVIDTANSTVGIRGRLIVDGLIRATTAEFDELTAGSAFFGRVYSELINSNTIIANRIIAGVPPRRYYALTPEELAQALIEDAGVDNAGNSNFILELLNPVTAGNSPNDAVMKLWRPADNKTHFELTRGGDMKLSGNLSVGKNAVFRTNLTLPNGQQDTTKALVQIGSSIDNGFSFWIGKQQDYTATVAEKEERGFFWVRDTLEGGDVRAGFNAELFMGDMPFAQPTLVSENNAGATTIESSAGLRAAGPFPEATSAGTITLRAARNGTMPLVLLMASVNLARVASGATQANKRFRLSLCLVNASSGVELPAVQTIEMDDYQPETYSAMLIGVSASVPAGAYKVRVKCQNIDPGADMAILQRWTCFAQYVRGTAPLSPLL